MGVVRPRSLASRYSWAWCAPKNPTAEIEEVALENAPYSDAIALENERHSISNNVITHFSPCKTAQTLIARCEGGGERSLNNGYQITTQPQKDDAIIDRKVAFLELVGG